MNLKDYKFNAVEDFIVYLQHLIIISANNIKFYETQLNNLNNFIQKEGLKDLPKAVVAAEVYEHYRATLTFPYSQLVNIIGDQAAFGLSYQNYRKAIEKKGKKLQIDYYELSLEEKAELNRITTARDWSSHVPVSLIHSTERNLNKERKEYLINIPDFKYYEAEWIISLFEQNNANLKGFKTIFELMKNDYSKITNSSDNISWFKASLRSAGDLIIPKISWGIQTKKIKNKDEIIQKYSKDEK